MNNQKTNLRQVKIECQNSVFFMLDPLGSGNCLPSRGGNMYSWKYVLAVIGITILVTFIYVETAKAEIINTASYYSAESLVKEGTRKQGEKQVMANGKEFKDGLTCASRDYELGEMLRVRNNANGKSVNVMVTDRIGKRFKGKRIDLSQYAFSQISNIEQGIISVSITEVK